MRELARMTDLGTRLERLRLLERALLAPSRWVRDGALFGLALTEDPKCIPHLRQAIQKEQVPELRQDMEHVLAYLEGKP